MPTAINNTEYVTSLADIINRFHTGVITQSQMVTELQTLVDNWTYQTTSTTLLGTKLSEVLGNWNHFTSGQLDWLTVPADGGPYNNGTVDLVDYLGNTTNVDSLKKLMSITAKGDPGTDGGIPFTFDNATADAAPAAGGLRLNNADPIAATMLFISDTLAAGDDVSAYHASLDDSSTTPHARIYLRQGAHALVYDVTGAVVAGTGYHKIPVTHVSGATAFTGGGSLVMADSRSGDVGAQGPQGTQGPQGATGAAATVAVGSTTTGAAGSSAAVTNSGSSSAAVLNFTIPKGDTGAQGPQGIQGNAGPTGATGPSVFLTQVFNTATAAADPGNGKFALNNASLASVTAAYVDNLDDQGTDVSAFLDTFDDSTNTAKGYLIFRQVGGPTKFAIFRVTGAVVNSTGYRTIPLAYVSGGALFDSGAQIGVGFYRSGDKGADGAGSGNVNTTGPVTAGHLAVYADTTGTVLQDGGAIPVTSVAGKTGAVTLVKGDVGLGNVDNTSDANKPVSTAQQTALNGKLDVSAKATQAIAQGGTDDTDYMTAARTKDAITQFAPASSGSDPDTIMRLTLAITALQGNQYGTPNGITDDFSDSDGVDAGNSTATYSSTNKDYVSNAGASIANNMTSNTAPAGSTASASSIWNSSFDAFKAFDGSLSTFWQAASGAVSPWWLQRQFTAQQTIASYAITGIDSTTGGANFANFGPSAWTLQGSNDGSSWTTLDTQSGQTGWTSNQVRTFTLANPATYYYFRLNITGAAGGGTNEPAIAEFTLNGAAPAFKLQSVSYTALSAPSKANVLVMVKPPASFTLNTDLTMSVSRDGGTTWTQANLTQKETNASGFVTYEATSIDISAQPSGTSMKWRINGAAGKSWDVTALSFLWS